MRTVVITGGTGGLGTDVVRRLSMDYRCVVLGHAQADLTSEDSVRSAFESIGEIYGLVHLVGGWTGGTVRETALATWSACSPSTPPRRFSPRARRSRT